MPISDYANAFFCSSEQGNLIGSLSPVAVAVAQNQRDQ